MKQTGLILLCFVAAMLGAMIGNDISSPALNQRIAVPTAAGVAVTDSFYSTRDTSARKNSPVIAAVRRVGPAVVNIDTVVMRRTSAFGFADPFGDLFGSDPFTRLVPSKGQGSGFIIDNQKGYILTNDHVVQDAVDGKGKIRVSLPDKQTFEAAVVGADPQYDVAVLKIDGKNLPSVKLASSDDIVIGEQAIAIGNPFGFRNTVTVGVISAIDRSLDTGDGERLDGLVQTDAAINPGNSGGPLCDAEGNVIGMNTAILNGAEGLGFAIGASSIKPVVDELIKYRRVRHGWTGMEFWDISRRLADRLELPNTDGALVSDVYHNGPADSVGIKPGDVVLQANDVKISCVADLQSVLRNTRAGDNLPLVLFRKGKRINIKIQLIEVPNQ